ncbi:hypothetical protein QVD17_29130 [Tagetes erecta]|uniref:Uncharacterized protein n=1 Tax=Tagetes erecta TaxID=13708 RepID=A0AAD8NSL9_TARER|nr:hypothetical protein QVD17_29130 [Tagetes erecta]
MTSEIQKTEKMKSSVEFDSRRNPAAKFELFDTRNLFSDELHGKSEVEDEPVKFTVCAKDVRNAKYTNKTTMR